MQFHQHTLDNGLQIVAELNPAAQSSAVGFFVRTGSRDETPEVSGVSHFLEHMAFKGDDKFSAEDVNRIFDEVGASYNAATSEEMTWFYAAFLPEYFDRIFELLATLMRPSLRQDDFDVEKQVILEEIGMYEDMPAFCTYDHAMSLHFANHPLGNSILGTNESITDLTAEQMQEYHSQRYGANNLVLAATGNLDWDSLVEAATLRCGEWNPGTIGRSVTEAAPVGESKWIVREQMNQQHLIQMTPAPAGADPLRFAASLVANIVGDDSTGRLYWDLVETGIAESADLSFNDYDGSGVWMTYACFPAENRDQVEQRIGSIFEEFNRTGPTEIELETARNKIASRIVLSSERPMGRLSPLSNNWIYQNEYRSVRDDLDTLNALTLDDIRTLLNRYPLGQVTSVGLGPVTS